MSFDIAHVYAYNDSVKFACGGNCCPSNPDYARELEEDYVPIGAAEVVIISFVDADVDLVFWRDDCYSNYNRSSFTHQLPDSLWVADLHSSGVYPDEDVPSELKTLWRDINENRLNIYKLMYLAGLYTEPGE